MTIPLAPPADPPHPPPVLFLAYIDSGNGLEGSIVCIPSPPPPPRGAVDGKGPS